MLSFELTEKTKYVFFVLSRAWDKETILSSHEESNLRLSVSALRCSTTESQRVCGEQAIHWSTHQIIPSISGAFCCCSVCLFLFCFLPDYFILWSVARKQFESRLVNLVHVNIDKLIDGLLIGRSRNMPPMPLVFLWLEMKISRIMRNWLMACVKLPRCCYLHE